MNRKKLWILITGLFLLVLVAVVAGIRHIPYAKLWRISSGEENSFVDSSGISQLPPNTLHFDFEVAPGKEIPADVFKGNAHSGYYATKAFGKNTFAFSIERKAKEIGLEHLDQVAMSAWVYVEPTDNEVNASLVFAASNEVGVNIAWHGVHVGGPEVPKATWFKISGKCDLEKVPFQPDSKIQIYFWNNSNTDILIDDYHIVFGKPENRKGDSTLIDLTRTGSNIRHLNMPPFPVLFLERQLTEQLPSSSLVPSDDKKTNELTSHDLILPGYFIENPERLDAILMVKPDGQSRSYLFNPEQNRFKVYLIRIPGSFLNGWNSSIATKGRFTGRHKEEILRVNVDHISLYRIERDRNNDQDGEILLKQIWDGPSGSFKSFNPARALFAGASDLDGDGQSELLLVDSLASWGLYRYRESGSGSWVQIASGDMIWHGLPAGEKGTFSITPGTFLPGRKGDQLLLVFGGKEAHPCGYTLLSWNNRMNHFETCMRSRTGESGKTIGLDTLKPSDFFFTGPFDPAKPGMVIRLNRDWRFDLKTLIFNDSAFNVQNNIDFSGYEQDYNPKYYEMIRFIPGRFLDPRRMFLLVICRNCKDYIFNGGPCMQEENVPELPNRTDIYGFFNVKR